MKAKWALLFAVLLLLNGCVYYNTFYNAKKNYNSAHNRPLTNNRPNSQASDEYTKTIKKCGYILTEYRKSKYADDALFLLSKALFYKGNSSVQAMEKCEDLIKFYPNSPLIPEAKLFLAEVQVDLKKNREAVSGLQDFLQNPDYAKYYPRALLRLSEISLKNKAYAQAQFYLQKIIDNYPKSREYKLAYFQLGKSYYEEKDYERSNQIFQNLLRSHLRKETKLDARYYIALNDFNLKRYDNGLSEIKKLLKKDVRTDNIPPELLLKARFLLYLHQNKDAVALYQTVIERYPRTIHSAEANYYLGEYYLSYLHDYEKAIQYYNKVKSEAPTSPYIEDALSKSSVASQIILYYKKDVRLSLKETVDEQMKLAEYYLHNINIPDSAFSVYRNLRANRNALQLKLDTLNVEISRVDSLYRQMAPDSLSLQHHEPISAAVPDSSLKTDQSTTIDSLVTTKEKHLVDTVTVADSAKADSTVFKQTAESDTLRKLKNQLTTLCHAKKEALTDLQEYDREFVPYTYFVQIWVYKYSAPDSVQMKATFDEMNRLYPLNKYTHAASLLIHDQEVVVKSEAEIQQENEYESAMQLYVTAPDSARYLLKDIASREMSPITEKARFTLGYLYWFQEHDSLQAKPYFDSLLVEDPTGEYGKFINQFYDGKYFIFTSVLPSIKLIEEKEERARKTAEEAKEKEQSDKQKKPAEQPKNAEQSTTPPVSPVPDDTQKSEAPPEIRE